MYVARRYLTAPIRGDRLYSNQFCYLGLVDEVLDDDVRTFLRDIISTHEQLEVLLLLLGARDRAFTFDEIGTRLRITISDAAEAADALVKRGVIRRGAAERSVRVPELVDPNCEKLVRACEERRLEVMKLMSQNAIDRLRNDVLRTFADAFVVGKDKKNG